MGHIGVRSTGRPRVSRSLMSKSLLLLTSLIIASTALSVTVTPAAAYVSYTEIEKGTYWTPILIVNSPYGGSASVRKEMTFRTEIYVGVLGTAAYCYSEETGGFELSCRNGMSYAMFELAEWTIYEKWVYPPAREGRPFCEGRCAAVTKWWRVYQPIVLDLEGDQSDEDLVTKITSPYLGVSYESVTFDARYKSCDATYLPGALPYSVTKSGESGCFLQLGIAVGAKTKGVSIQGSLYVKYTCSSSYYASFTFDPAPAGYMWNTDWLNNGGCLCAFKYTNPQPSISSPPDVSIKQGTFYYVTWSAWDDDPTTFEIYRGSTLVMSGTWSSGDYISVKVDTANTGYYTYTCKVKDSSGQVVSDAVGVTVYPKYQPL